MRRASIWSGALVCVGLAIGLFTTRPAPLDPSYAAGHQGNGDAGRLVFVAAGCASCHATTGTTAEAKLTLAGGLAFSSEFGTFYAPNISSDPDHGIGAWTLPEFARAVTQGVSRTGQHHYPAFPYTAYAHALPKDVSDLYAYFQTLPASDVPSKAHELPFPFNIRRGLVAWKLLYLEDGYSVAVAQDDVLARGQYLVEALAHCGECHTPCEPLGALDTSRWLEGAPNPSGKGKIPGLTPDQLDWSEGDIVEYLTSGFTPDYDSAGGEMVHVIENVTNCPAVIANQLPLI